MSVRHLFHVPDMHCAGCISRIEKHLSSLPEVLAARVNLTLKQVVVEPRQVTEPEVLSPRIIAALDSIGFPASPLNPDSQPLEMEARLKALLLRVAVAGFGMMNVMLLSVAVWSGADAATRQMLHLVSGAIALPVLIFSAQPFFVHAIQALRVWRLNMDVPISLAILLAAGNSLYATLTGEAEAYFDAALALTFFLLAGRYLDLKAQGRAKSAAAGLAKLQVNSAIRITHGKPERIAVDQLVIGDVIRILPGDMIPADGVISRGESVSDRSFITGEAVPIPLTKGEEVFAGESNLTGQIDITVTKLSQDSLLQHIIMLVEQAEQGRNRYTAIADRAAAIYAPMVHLTAAAAFGFWMLMGADPRMAFNTAIAVLIITCPCALGLAVPVVMTVANARLFAKGVLLKSATALERLAGVDMILFDKTGTLTSGRFALPHVMPLPMEQRAMLYALASASHHPYARAVAAAMAPQKEALTLPEFDTVTHYPGKGVEAKQGRISIRLGRLDWVDGTDLLENSDGQRGLAFRVGKGATVFLPLEEEIRPGTAAMLAQLDQAGYRRALVTGDQDTAGRQIAATLGFAEIYTAMTPEAKAALVAARMTQGETVMMVGDGLNDAPAMAGAGAGAGLSLAPASANDATRAAADVVVLGMSRHSSGAEGPDMLSLSVLPYLLRVARLARRRMHQNFALAVAYNLIAVPLAFAGLATPLLAALAMSASSLTVSLNALRLPRTDK